MTAKKEDTALGVARARFVDGLPRKATELKGAVALLAATPDAEKPREEMRRRLHALFASAQVFRIDSLAEALRECIEMLDRARDEKRELADEDLDRLAHVAATLPSFAQGEEAPSTGASVAPSSPGFLRAPSTLPSTSPLSSPGTSPLVRPLGSTAPSSTPLTSPGTSPLLRPPGSTAPSTSPLSSPGTPTSSSTPIASTQSGFRVPTPTSTPAVAGATTPSSSRPGVPAWTKLPTPALGTSRPGPIGGTRAGDGEPVLALDTIVSVLLVGATAERVAPKLPAERFEVVRADEGDAILKARVSAPDVVLVGDEIVGRPGASFVSTFRADTATDLLPLIAVPSKLSVDVDALRRAGADDVLPFGADTHTIAERIAKVTGLVPGTRSSGLGTLTVRQLADRVADEIRRGIVESVETGIDVPVALGEGSEVLAAALSAIARVRTIVSTNAADRVRFRATRGRTGPSLVAIGETTQPGTREDVSLAGRRAIVVDDDPAVVWFFAGLLREAGATVVECQDGTEALRLARQKRPDVILSDILMPGLDGLALCREVQRDPFLADVPVILLSWKEDFLQRMRELRSGASGYLRKEEGASQILDRVKTVLRPRARFEARLREGGEARGRVEGLGVLPILRSVAEVRRDAHLTMRDAYNLFEIEIRDGHVVHITRTASDGTFARGARALPQLLGVTAGRFAVTDSDAPVRGAAEHLGPEALEDAAARLGALLDAVSGTGMPRADSVDLDPGVLASLLPVSPGPATAIARRLEAGDGPRKLLLEGEIAPETLESVLVDFARRGAIVGVTGTQGEDRVAACLRRRVGEPSIPPPRAVSERPPAVVASASREDLDTIDEEPIPVGVPQVEPEAMDEWISIAKGADTAEPAPDATTALAREDEELVADVTDVSSIRPGPLPLEERFEEAPTDKRPVLTEATVATKRAPEPAPTATPVAPKAAAVPSAPKAPAIPAREPAPERGGVGRYVGYTLALLALAGAGFFVVHSVVGRSRGGARVARAPHEEASHAGDTAPARTESPAPASARLANDGPLPEVVALHGRSEAGVAVAGIPVAANQGALVIEAASAGPAPIISVGARALGPAPARTALEAGRYVVTLRLDDEERVRVVDVEAGRTRVLTP